MEQAHINAFKQFVDEFTKESDRAAVKFLLIRRGKKLQARVTRQLLIDSLARRTPTTRRRCRSPGFRISDLPMAPYRAHERNA